MELGHEDVTRAQLTRAQFLRTLAAAVAIPGVVAGCDRGDTAPKTVAGGGTPKRGGRLRVGHVGGGTAETVDPNAQVGFIDAARCVNLYDPLATKAPNGNVVMQLADSMEPNADATEWSIKLKQGVEFHNGKSLSADDVLFTFRRIVNGKGSGASALSQVDLKASRRERDGSLRMVLTRPVGDLPLVLSSNLLVITAEGERDFRHPIGTGPFKFRSFTPGSRSLFVRNENYWVSGKPYVDELEQISIPDNTARFNALQSGQIDALEFMDLTQAKANANNNAIRLIITKGPTSSPMTMRCDRGPLADVRVRQAIKHAIDRAKTVDVAFQGYGSIGNDVFGKGLPSYNDHLPQRDYDPEKAKALLREAGVENFRVELITAPAGPGLVESATALAEQAKAAGMDIKVNRVAADDLYNTDRYYLKAPFTQTQWGGLAFEEIARSALLTDAPFNETGWYHSDFDKRFYAAQGVVDEADRNRAYQALQDDIWERGGYLIWGFQDVVDAVSPRVHGVVPNARFNLGLYDFRSYWLA